MTRTKYNRSLAGCIAAPPAACVGRRSVFLSLCRPFHVAEHALRTIARSLSGHVRCVKRRVVDITTCHVETQTHTPPHEHLVRTTPLRRVPSRDAAPCLIAASASASASAGDAGAGAGAAGGAAGCDSVWCIRLLI
jgi:hypothetical protein